MLPPLQGQWQLQSTAARQNTPSRSQ